MLREISTGRFSSATVARGPSVVIIEGTGAVCGEVIDDVVRFLAIPYAAAPVGHLRWAPPQKPRQWHSVRPNPRILPICPQPGAKERDDERSFIGHRTAPSEDCLVLNVFTPASALRAARTRTPSQLGPARDATAQPVLFYIHGGAGRFGSCFCREAHGQELAAQHDVVLVAPNYRLGVLGFCAHPAIGEGSGSFGLLDLVAALEWVRDHIASFGGDPTNVTIWGLSTGSQLVQALLGCPLAAGLFHRAMMQSCTDLVNVRDLTASPLVWRCQSARQWGEALAEALLHRGKEGAEEKAEEKAAEKAAEKADQGKKTGGEEGPPLPPLSPPPPPLDADAQLAAMRELSANYLNSECAWEEAASDCYEPTIDRLATRAAKPRAALDALLSGSIARVPLMIGVTEHDGLGKCELEWLMTHEEPTDVPSYEAMLALFFGQGLLPSAFEHYPAKTDAEVEGALGAISNDLWYHASTWLTADLAASLRADADAAEQSSQRGGDDGAPAADVFVYRVTEPGFTRHGHDSPLWCGIPSTRTCKVLGSGSNGGTKASGEANGHGHANGHHANGKKEADAATGGAAGAAAMAYLANFARFGTPNGGQLPRWDAHAPGSYRYMRLGAAVLGGGGDVAAMEALDGGERQRMQFMGREYIMGIGAAGSARQ